MYKATWMYPELLPATTKQALKYNKVTKADIKKLARVAEYVHKCEERHEYILAPKSLKW
jgi:hypothetical protein